MVDQKMVESPQICLVNYWRIFTDRLGDFSYCTAASHVPKHILYSYQWRVGTGCCTCTYMATHGGLVTPAVRTYIVHPPEDILSTLDTAKTDVVSRINTVNTVQMHTYN
jgi:hypothetical protein